MTEKDYGNEYNLAAIRSLIRAAFTVRELKRFCQDCRAFRPLLSAFGQTPILEDMIDAIVEYCEKQLLCPELLAEIQAFNARQFERYRRTDLGTSMRCARSTWPICAAPTGTWTLRASPRWSGWPPCCPWRGCTSACWPAPSCPRARPGRGWPAGPWLKEIRGGRGRTGGAGATRRRGRACPGGAPTGRTPGPGHPGRSRRGQEHAAQNHGLGLRRRARRRSAWD